MEAAFRFNRVQLVTLLALLFAATFTMAQGIATGSISGTLVDPSGAVVSAASVTAQNVETNLSLTTQTNDSGYFTFRNVPPGTYNVIAWNEGVSSDPRSAAVPDAGVAELDFTLR